MLSEADRNTCATILLEAARTKRQAEQLSKRFPAIDFDDAYAIQAETIRRRVAEGRRVVGYKIGLTSKAMQRSSGIDEPDYGILLDDMMYADGAKINASDFCVPRVEVELSFVLSKPLQGPGLTVPDVLRATEYVVPSLELIDARLLDPRKIYDTIADNGAAAGIVLGGRPVRPDAIDLRWAGAALYKNGEVEETGLAAGIMGHPAMGIVWLANRLGPHGIELPAGQILLAGSFTRPIWCKAGDTVQADFGTLGQVAVQFV
ncbi:MAG TPA: 2-oxo-hepta-3-ene-1,7-dioic acid hydratase [Hyphomicrobiaceae bacterium]|nr:2-oxo-hepta-3-ene-1,7-dioic acid hydratase [Hyphomicrobiaceae bacterium]